LYAALSISAGVADSAAAAKQVLCVSKAAAEIDEMIFFIINSLSKKYYDTSYFIKIKSISD
jgi:hypothetical protein